MFRASSCPSLGATTTAVAASGLPIVIIDTESWGGIVVKALLYCSVEGPRDRSPITGDFFRGIRQFHVPWGRLTL